VFLLSFSTIVGSFPVFLLIIATYSYHSLPRVRDGTDEIKPNLARSIRFFEYVIEQGDSELVSEALWELYSVIENHPTLSSKLSSWDLLTRSAAAGQPEAQHLLATAFATGLYKTNLVPTDPVKAVVLDHFAALSGNAEAALATAQRFFTGTGVVRSCKQALPFFEYAAYVAVQSINEQLPQTPGQAGHSVMMHWLDTSYVSETLHPQGDSSEKQGLSEELVDYYVELARSSDVSVAATLGMLLLSGSQQVNCVPNTS
jgi:hypothetical protein